MFFARDIRLVAVAGSLAALMAVSACGGGGDPGTGSPSGEGQPSENAAFQEKGPITFVTGKDNSGNLQSEVDEWNKDHAGEEVKIIELPDNADQQRAAMIQNAESQGTEYTVLNVDVVWTAEFAANGYIEELPADQFDFSGFLPVTVDSATYFDKLYAVPVTSDGGLLYYRSDWLQEAGIEPPTTYDEMKTACTTIKEKVAAAKDADCFAGQHDKYEGLTVNLSEAVDSAGGHITDDAGAATANSPEAVAGLTWMSDAFKDGTIPKAALTWKEEEGRIAFQDEKLIFHRNWPYVYALANSDDGSSKVNGKFEVAPLPGLTGPGVSSLGGHNYAISKTGKNKGTAIEFMQWMSSEERMVARTEATSNAPTRTSLYSDEALTKEFPYLPVLQKSIEGARPRPKVVKYGDVTLAIQDAAYSTLQGQKEPQAAMDELQSKLEPLVAR